MILTQYYTETLNFTTNTASENSTVSPMATMISTEDSSDFETKIVCRPPDLDNETADNGNIILARIRRRQRQIYQNLIIMNKTRFNKICRNMVGSYIVL